MAYKALATVNGVALPDPSDYNATTSTLVDSARNVKGVMIGDVIRENVSKVEMNWNYLPRETWAEITKLFDSKRGGNFIQPVEFLNQDTGLYETKQMYVSDRTAGAYYRDRYTMEIRGWTNCRLALIEV
jgi:hypothetical protein